MKRIFLQLLILFFLVSCSKEDSISEDNNSGNNDNDVGWNGNSFSPLEVNVRSHWTFDSNQKSKLQLGVKATSHSMQLKAYSIDYTDSLDAGILSIESPKTGELTSSEVLSIKIGNYGYLPILDSLKVSYQFSYEDGEFSDPIIETVKINDTLLPVEAIEYSFATPLDMSNRGTYQILASTQFEGDMDLANDSFTQIVKSLEYTEVCNIHSLIFNEDDSFKLYTLDEDGVCNYVILGEYKLDDSNSLLRLYSPDSAQESNLIGNIYDVATDDDGGFSGTIAIEGICIQLEDGFQERNYSQELTYIPDENLENYLIEIGKDDVVDGYITNSQAASISQVSIEANDNWEVGSTIDFWNFEERFSNRISNLAGIEAFPNLESVNLMGQNLDSINISKNINLKTFSANFNTFKKLDTSNNPLLESLSIDSNEVNPILDFSNNPNIKMLSTPMCSIAGFIGEDGYYDISNMADLEFLDLYDNRLTSVDISKNTKLKELRINMGNSISTIDFSNNPMLENISANSSGLQGNVDISNLTELQILNLANNDINAIDVSNNTKLKYLEIDGNQITGEIDVSNCTNLLEFYASNGNNISCIKVNQAQLDAYNGNNVPEGFKWQLSVEPKLNCN